MAFIFAYFVGYKKGYQLTKLECCRLSGSCFTEGLEKHNDEVVMTWLHIAGIRNFHIFMKLDRLLIDQVTNLLIVWIKFYGGWYKTPKNTIMTSILGFHNCIFCRT